MGTYKYSEHDSSDGLLGSLANDIGSELIGNIGSGMSLNFSNAPTGSSNMAGSKMIGNFSSQSFTNGVGGLKNINGMDFGKMQQGMQGVGTALKMFGAAGQLLDGITGAFGLNTEQVNQSSADRAGFGKANKLTGIINKIPGAKFMTAFGATTIKDVTESSYWNSIGSGFSGTRKDTDAAKDIGGSRMLFGAKKAQAFVDTVNAQNALITQIGQESEMARNNDVGQLYQRQNFNKYNGHTPGLLLSKNGGVISELESSRKLLKKSRIKSEIQKCQLGGKIINSSKNIIPDGALHKNLNHLSEHNDDLKDQITKKGIPVISENADGTITQHAEVEVGEVIFNLENTKIIEDYWQQYKETGDDSIAIECGKFLTKELLRNTVDKAGIKKEIE